MNSPQTRLSLVTALQYLELRVAACLSTLSAVAVGTAAATAAASADGPKVRLAAQAAATATAAIADAAAAGLPRDSGARHAYLPGASCGTCSASARYLSPSTGIAIMHTKNPENGT
jgi:hypothetical protein